VTLESGELRFAGGRLHFLEGGPPDAFPVLLLHGQRFTSATWRELGTLDLLMRQGYRVLALDLPGYGQSEPSSLSREELLAALVPLLFERPVAVVAPSMSGSFSLPLVAHRPSFVAGFIPVAPGAIDQNLESLRGSKVPTLIVWGEKDTVISPKKADVLARAMVASRKVILRGASHPCYLDKPIEFHRELLQFLRGLR
jgi:abhydrolase domain-containing protein 14